ncbi:MAG: hypothetical protein M3Y58_12895 [Chloroflexota bacterium]|nr:hypothetical protein [Chloroflexota bacterium]
MTDETENSLGIEHDELIDMRTHLTVAMLAASQLTRKTQHLPEAAHLREYLDQSLRSLVEDVGKVDALVAQIEEYSPTAVEAPRYRRLSRPRRWIGNLLQHGTHALCSRIHRRHYTRIVAPSFYR